MPPLTTRPTHVDSYFSNLAHYLGVEDLDK